ncbi:ABC transporter ATP-binding protein [Actinocrinis puniceicyclus]|uniref:ABC transporter ATP-binding protein n=1 Tax=Actinocrinis puniceicyclus TaxID=977794 RepID=A0A8J8BB99_9ACTN|nr:ABC transporter ATP-binding protein [Actinocrinis puniceicyclus]MBS2962230.1 ABC transporter ATP-binding protein [Actinocrinis puniceicyclus]
MTGTAATGPAQGAVAGARAAVTGPAAAAETATAGTAAPETAATGAGGSSRGDAAIATYGLSKRYRGGQLAVDGLDLAVPPGAVFGFLGPNGSGKTTTIRMLMALIGPSAGRVELFGEPIPRAANRVLPRVGALIEGPAHYPYLTGAQNLARYDAADRSADPRTRTARVGEALERVGLSNASRKKAKAYSLGMKQRLGLAAALLQPRDLLVLDEPTNGLDPQGMREIRSLIKSLAADGTTVFLSSHLLDEIEQVCTHAAVMSRGRLVTQGTVAQLGAGLRARLVVTTPDTAAAETVLSTVLKTASAGGDGAGDGGEGAGAQVQVEGDRVSCDADGLEPDAVCAALVGAGVRVFGFAVQRPSLEDAFVALTGEGFDVAQ